MHQDAPANSFDRHQCCLHHASALGLHPFAQLRAFLYQRIYPLARVALGQFQPLAEPPASAPVPVWMQTRSSCSRFSRAGLCGLHEHIAGQRNSRQRIHDLRAMWAWRCCVPPRRTACAPIPALRWHRAPMRLPQTAVLASMPRPSCAAVDRRHRRARVLSGGRCGPRRGCRVWALTWAPAPSHHDGLQTSLDPQSITPNPTPSRSRARGPSQPRRRVLSRATEDAPPRDRGRSTRLLVLASFSFALPAPSAPRWRSACRKVVPPPGDWAGATPSSRQMCSPTVDTGLRRGRLHLGAGARAPAPLLAGSVIAAAVLYIGTAGRIDRPIGALY